MLGKEAVQEIKNIYLLADEFDTPSEYIKLSEDFNKSGFCPRLA